MNTCHSFSVVHLQLDGGVAIAKKPGQSAPYASSAFYQSPKAVGSLDSALAKFLEGAPREQLYINLVPEFASIQSFSDASLTKKPDTLADLLTEATGKSPADCNLRILDAKNGQAAGSNSPILVSMLEKAKIEKAMELGKTLGFEKTSVFNSTLTTIAGLDQWRSSSSTQESVAILEIGMEQSQVTINTTQGLIFSRTVPVSLKKIAATIQGELNLKFDSAALMLFFNGIFDFTRISPKIAAAVAEELKPELDSMCSKHKCSIDRLLVCSLPPSFTWLNKAFSEATELKPIDAEELSFLEDREQMGDVGKNPSFLAPTVLAHAKCEDIPFLADHKESTLESECGGKSAGSPVSAPVAAATPAPAKVEEPKKEEAPKAETPKPEVKKEEVKKPVSEEKPAPKPEAKPEEKPAQPQATEQASSDNSQGGRRRKGKKGKKKNAPIVTNPKADPVVAKTESKKPEPAKAEAPKAAAAKPTAKEEKKEEKKAAVVTPMPPQEDEGKNKKMIIYGGVAAAALIGISLIFVLGGGDKDEPTSTMASTTPAVEETTSEETLPSQDSALGETELAIDTSSSTDALQSESDSDLDPTGDLLSSEANTTELAQTEATDAPLITIPEIADEEPEEEPVPEEPEILFGGIRLVSNPAGADVRMNGRTVGVTPMNIDGLEFGEYEFEIAKEPYLSESITVTLDSEDVVELPAIDLELPAGSVVVTSWPEGVAFDLIPVDALDDQAYSGFTPASFADVMKGEYKVVFHRDNWEDVTQTCEVLFKDTAKVDYSYPQGSLEITSTPSGATVFAGSKRLGVTPLVLDDIKAGTMDLSFRLENHEDAYTSVEVNAQDKNFTHQKLLSYDRIVSTKDLDVPPVTERARLTNLQHSVRGSHKFIIDLVVGKDGTPEDISIITSTDLELHDALLKDLNSWTFQPAVRKGHVVRTKVRVPIIIGNPKDLPESINVAQLEKNDDE